jgi:chromosome segregation ATPase
MNLTPIVQLLTVAGSAIAVIAWFVRFGAYKQKLDNELNGYGKRLDIFKEEISDLKVQLASTCDDTIKQELKLTEINTKLANLEQNQEKMLLSLEQFRKENMDLFRSILGAAVE